jgi:hypothetical protein
LIDEIAMKTPLIALSAACLLLTGCQTMYAMQDRISDLSSYSTIPDANNDEELLGFGNDCPQVQIVQELNTASDFESLTDPRPEELISRATLSRPETACEYRDGIVVVDLRIKVDGTLGPKGRIKPSDKPIFSYPFFVAVNKDSIGGKAKILAKEIFSASITYNKGEDAHTYYESMRQVIPAKSRSEGSKYKIYIGFQLTPEQLNFNRQNAAMTSVTAGVSPQTNDTPVALTPETAQ